MRDDRIVQIALPLGVFRKIFQMIPNSTVLDTAALKAARDFGDAIMNADNDMEGSDAKG